MDWSDAARKLADARLNGVKVSDKLRPEPADTDEAYALQAAVTDCLDKTVAGWKVGATNPAAQLALGAKEPFVGPIYEDLCFEAPAKVATPPAALRVTEAEFAFRLASDLPPRGAAYGLDEVTRAIGSVHPAIEIVDKRMPPPEADKVTWAIADGGANHAFVHGPGTDDLSALDLTTHPVRVSVNGRQVAEGSAGSVMGSPVMVLAWLATHMSGRGVGLKAGQWISTGLATPVLTTEIGDEVVADFGTLGAITVTMV